MDLFQGGKLNGKRYNYNCEEKNDEHAGSPQGCRASLVHWTNATSATATAYVMWLTERGGPSP
ncbi:hypothetical protein GCM10009655_09130 [Rhodoglobus aureus]|uniref:Uncharacterized protein n=1 Tax=Rhodoglobus aureus TaxID=191497 RepID=A0ABN1VHR4_9MICO